MVCRKLLPARWKSIAALLAFSAGLALPGIARAEDKDKAASALPLKKVVLYNAGVGFYERRAEIDGDAKIDLKFNATDINDLLKIMVLQDLGGGKISTVTYASIDPITKTLKTFAIDLTDNPTMAKLLDQVRGEKVEIESPNKIVGSILGVEVRKQRVGDKNEVVETEFLNLLTDTGLRSFQMSAITRIKLLDEKLDGELRQALTILAMGHATDKKTVSLNFTGAGKRPVRVGYIQQSPIWRTTYRLVLTDKEAPFLQGWALVENPTEEDWKDVSLTLVSGRPISFVMNLYQPLYVPRPMVETELFASLRPQVYGKDMEKAEREFAAKAQPSRALARGGMGGMGGDAPTPAAAPAPMSDSNADGFVNGDAKLRAKIDDQQMNLGQGVQSVAQAGDVGELFQYTIDSAVTLPRQQSAMLPIANGSVKGEKVSIYNPAVQAKHPLNGLKLTNSTGLHLMQGPVTVFDDGTYAGDARIEDLPPGSERLISYALDLDTEVAPESKPQPEQLVKVKIAKGTVITTRKFERSTLYTIKNSGKKDKKVLIEYPYDVNWKLLDPKEPEEKTRDMYRFAITAEPGKPTKLTVSEEQTVDEQIALTNVNDDLIAYYQRSKVVSEPVKKALAEVIKRKHEIQSLAVEQQQHQQQIAAITQEQGRIRENMTRLEKNTELYNRYVKIFGTQEDDVEKAREKIKELQAKQIELQNSLNEYMLGLEIG
jgi:hypothetical protein